MCESRARRRRNGATASHSHGPVPAPEQGIASGRPQRVAHRWTGKRTAGDDSVAVLRLAVQGSTTPGTSQGPCHAYRRLCKRFLLNGRDAVWLGRVHLDSRPGHPASRTSRTSRTAVVTGAGSGIGRAVAGTLLARGTTVIGVDRDGLDALPAGSGLRPVTGDLRDPAVVDRVGAAVGALPEGLDLLANVAGVYRASRLDDSNPDVLAELFGVNVAVPCRLLAVTLAALERGGGAVVNVSSTFGHRASRTGGGYGASKAAVEELTRRWATELAPRGVRVNCVAPGPTETPILVAAGLPAEAVTAQRAAERRRVPFGRLGTADEIASWITRLAEPGVATGQVVSVDGGLSCE